MSIAYGFLAQSAQVGGLTISGHTVFGLTQNGNPLELKSDGELFSKVTPVIPENIMVEIETRDIGTAADVGTSGALSLVAAKMVGGKTLTGSATYAAVSSTIVSVTRGTDIHGNAVARIAARINSADGAASGLTITLA